MFIFFLVLFIILCIVMFCVTLKNSNSSSFDISENEDLETNNFTNYTKKSRLDTVLDIVELEYEEELKKSKNLSEENNFGLPQEIYQGKKIYKIYNCDVVGSKYTHFGNYGQDGILDLNIGSYVTLKAEPDNIKDNKAVAVFTVTNKYCGWLPSGELRSITIFNNLMKGVPAKAIVTDKYIREYDKTWCIKIAVGLYSEPAPPEPEIPKTEFELKCLDYITNMLLKNNIPLSSIESFKSKSNFSICCKFNKNYYTIRIKSLKKYNYVHITYLNDIAKIKKLKIPYEDAPKSEEGIRVIIKSPSDLEILSDIIIENIKKL